MRGMRQVYTSPRHENVDRVVAYFSEHGIESRVENRSVWKRPSYERFSYRDGNRAGWPQVWVTHAKDYTRARELLRALGIEPVVRHGEELAVSRQATQDGAFRRSMAPARVRRALLIGIVLVVAVVQALRYVFHAI